MRLAGLAELQYAVVTLDQLRALGLSRRAVQARKDSGRLHRIYHSVYSLVPLNALTREGRLLAAVLACGPDAALSYRSAAALHELRRTDRANIDVTIPQRSPRKHAGIDIHRSTTLAPGDITAVHQIPCTTVARTLLDLGQVIGTRAIERACDQAEILGVLDVHALQDQIDRNHARPASKRLREVLERHYIGSTPTWSELEEAFLALCRRAGLPAPEINVWIDPHDSEPAIRVDFVWHDDRLIVETDGHRTHSTRQAFELDRQRDQRLTVAGWKVIRTTWRQIMTRPDELAAILRSLLDR